MTNLQPHKFHIPVMGLAFTVDSPIKVARFGISSVISIVEDRLMEMMRKQYYPLINQPYFEISNHETDFRAKRVTDYLNLVNTIVHNQLEALKKLPFEKGSEIVQYFEMLPDDNKLKEQYLQMLACENAEEKVKLENYLRSHILAGSIDVNIMTKLDRENAGNTGAAAEDSSDAVAALRGYANSNLKNSSIVFSAGLNPRLYNYLEKCSAFEVNEDGGFNKKVIIKVSDYRSALIQGKYLAKKGVWVSEFRIESGLNCGGHAFATDGFLLGPILEEFKTKKQELIDTLLEIFNAAVQKKTGKIFVYPPNQIISVQGGIGTAGEDHFLHSYYGVESTGWGTPFLLVPEATTVDEHTMELLCKAKKEDVVLSHNSPLGVRFHYLKGTTSDIEKQQRIQKNKPGSPCTEKHLAFNTEFGPEPICTASRKYQKLKIAELQSMALPEKEYQQQLTGVLAKECLCVGLSNAATIKYEQLFVKNMDAVTICPGPNIAYFNKVVTLQTMTDHIYGRTNIMDVADRPNLFVAELGLYLNFIKEQLENENGKEPDVKRKRYYTEFFKNLHDGISYYKQLPATPELNYTAFMQAMHAAEQSVGLLENELQELAAEKGLVQA
ncbi:hypothetical protein QWZ08_20305 [Ferruginibacter paludis]|uniref:hypothetical protein n=1 Tax=Ferruginibacter paludis TaxID=1310417 RepID=UPI0025B4AB6D|nr:hypothetical protein [Ferruginibacter paludis]MDN3658005.1 hypothetical protein [Ferruginibacter paludis]